MQPYSQGDGSGSTSHGLETVELSGAGRAAESLKRMGPLDSDAVAAIFEAAVDALIVIDEAGIIQVVNSSAVSNFGFTSDAAMIGQNVSILMPHPESIQHDSYLRTYQATGNASIMGVGREVMGRRHDGTEFPMHLSISEFEVRGERRFLGICHDVTERRAFLDQITAMAKLDALTGFANRAEGVRFLTELIASVGTMVSSIGLAFIDLDDFKGVNDHYGHAVGDRVLQIVAERMRAQLPSDALIARMGGDEFLVIQPVTEADGLASVASTAEAMVAAISEPLPLDARLLHIGASAGISEYPGDAETVEELIGVADIAMYDAKRSTIDQIRRFHPAMKERADQQYDLLVRLRQGIEDSSFELHYQLQFDLETLEPVGIEALVRWRDGDRGLIAPGGWMELALQSGLTQAIGRWVIDRACHDNARLIETGVLDVPVAINVCVPLFGESDFIDLLRCALEGSGLPRNRVEIEVIEDVAMTSAPTLLENVRILSEAGIAIAMDDFGTGFSSLQQLHKGYFSKLKLDRSFVSRLPGQGNDHVMVQTMVDLARGLGLDTVAEGIEDAEQAEILRSMGCSKAQGFWYAKPVPFDGLPAALAQAREVARAHRASQ